MTTVHPADAGTASRTTLISWRIEPQGWFSRHFDLYQDEKFITTLHMQFWQEGCDFRITGHDFTIRKPSIWKDAFQLLAAGESVCDAQRSFWSRRFDLVSAEQAWGLQPAGWLSAVYQLLAGEHEAGRVARAGLFSRRRVAWFDHNVPPPIQVLAIFLVLIVGQRQNKSN